MSVGSVELENYPILRRGKVRDVFDLGDDLLLVATDRLSTFDVVMPDLLPGKGVILTEISTFWFEGLRGDFTTQISDRTLDDFNFSEQEQELLKGRSVVARKAERIDIECVVRAWLAGTAFKEYQEFGTVAGVAMPTGLSRGSQLPEPLFTPAIKNDDGHDENISVAKLRDIIGQELAEQLERTSLALFDFGSRGAARADFVLADSKFEFGWIDGELSVIDEVFTPDSSRYWDRQAVGQGIEPPQYDKQIARDWLEQSGWNKQPPGPHLPPDIIELTLDRYRSVATRLRQTRDTA